VRVFVVVVGSLCMLPAGCSSSSGSRGATATTTATTTVTTCATPTRFGAEGATNELHGSSTGAELWGLALGPGSIPPHPGDELKIVWHMTGTGPLRVVFSGPDGRRHALIFGPEPHASSTYDRPGEEWGTGFRFTAAGCWHVRLIRNIAVDVWLNVQ
jgi:hypothetical protein